MNVLLRCVVLALAGFGVAYVVASVVVAVHWARHRPVGAAAARAGTLLRLRLVPIVTALAVLLFSAIGLYRFESRDGDEVLGWVLVSLGGFGAALVVMITARLVRLQWHTRALMRAWMADAEPFERPGLTLPAYRLATGFPIVAVLGILRPRLVIDRSVLDSCSAEELTAILAHEQGHVHRLDNLRRLAFAAAPGLPWSKGLSAAWCDATEEAADDAAAASGPDTRFHLASALLRVSRLAPHEDGWQTHLPASALYRGDGLERRVRRLVEPSDTPSRPQRPWFFAAGAVVLTTGFALQRHVHDLMEMIVATLP
jgi:Zn-dependent protease with chaperone function